VTLLVEVAGDTAPMPEPTLGVADVEIPRPVLRLLTFIFPLWETGSLSGLRLDR
jgi:hypothetical protein